MIRNAALLSYRAVENPSPWNARHASAPSGFRARVARLLLAAWDRLYHPLPVRAGVAALVLAPSWVVAHAFTGADPLEQSLPILVLALVMGAVQTLVDPHVATRFERVGLSQRALSTACEVQPSMVEPVAKLPAAPATGKAFDDMVRRALTHLCDPTKLSLSPLLQLSLITTTLQEQGLEDTRLQRVAILKSLLTDLVNSLQPHQRTDGCTSAAHRFYNCLYYPYVRGITRRNAPAVLRQLRERREREGGSHTEHERVLDWLLQVNEDTYYKWQRRASDTIALILRERENLFVGSPSSAPGLDAVSVGPNGRSLHWSEDRAILRPVS